MTIHFNFNPKQFLIGFDKLWNSIFIYPLPMCCIELRMATKEEWMMKKISKCAFVPPTPGYAPCTRLKGHDGPCAHAQLPA